jgi:hypothetical protein
VVKIKKHEGTIERKIILAMITDKTVLSRIAQVWENAEFKAPHLNTIAGWCCEYFDEYGEPPGSGIEDLFESWAKHKSRNKGEVETVEAFLSSISKQFDKENSINADYILEKATAIFNETRLKKLAQNIEDAIDSGNPARAEKATDNVLTFNRISLTASTGINVLSDKAALRAVFDRREDALITYPGALGRLLDNNLHRDGFVSFLGPEKRGKTFWLIDLAWKAIIQRRRTAFFQVGDLSERQMMQRFAIKVAARPKRPQKVLIPYKIKRSKESEHGVIVRHREVEFTDYMTSDEVEKAMSKFLHRKVGGFDDALKLRVYPNDTITADGIRSELRKWEREGWAPDVVIIDYADLLSAPPNSRDGRDAINQTWKRLRSISQEFHCLVATATQANAASYSAHLIRKTHFSDNKLKLAHVTGMIGLSQTDWEKEQDIMRLNWLVLRENEYSETRTVYCAGCRAIGSVARRSC